jgi:PIN domain nuclease of toxin-antitoxin system
VSEGAVDASGVIAAVLSEPATEEFATMLADSICRVSVVNLAEVVAKFAERGMESTAIQAGLDRFGFIFEPFTVEDAWTSGMLRPLTRSAGLSLGDRACLALAMRLGLPAVTMDRAWASLALPVTVIVGRP